jgi:hypothetical protein
MLARASLDLDPTTTEALAAGKPISPEMRDELLAKCARGEYVEIEVPMLAYEQRAGVDNRNFVGFRDGAMLAIGRTGRGKPFLRDHAQYNSLAVGGSLIESKTENPTEGHYAIRQTVRLTAPWAVEMYLRGLMKTVSIGWIPTGPVLCSVCGTEVFDRCYHWPGQRLAEVTDEKGAKRYERKRDGSILVRWIYTAAELIETSCVPVPGVPTAEMDQLRSALAAHVPGFSDDEPPAAALGASNSTPSSAAPTVESKMSDQNPDTSKQLAGLRKALAIALLLPEEHRAHAATLSVDELEVFLGLTAAERAASVQAAIDADPVVFEGKLTKRIVRRSDGKLAKQLAEDNEASAAKLAAQEERNATLAAAQDAAEVSTICRARLAKLPGSDEVHANIVRALRKAGDPALLEQSLAALAGAAASVERAAPGVNPGEDATDKDALTAFNEGVDAYAKANSIADRGAALDRFIDTPKGRELKRAYDATRAYGK